jgi:hypothetical protein
MTTIPRSRWPSCTTCREPLHPAAAAGGFTTHPDCDPGADPQPLAAVYQLRIPTTEGTADE